MAKPQVEKGYARLANELLEALSRINLSAYETRVLFFLLRKTYGWNKTCDFISISQIALGTGLPRAHSCRAKKSLLAKNILFEHDSKLGLNKDYETWGVTNIGTVTNSGNKTSIKCQKQQNVTNTGTVPESVIGVTNLGTATNTNLSTISGKKTSIKTQKQQNVTNTGTVPVQAPQKTIKTYTQKTRSSRVFDKGQKASNNGELFDRFWAEYPRKVAKKKCRQIWDRLKPSQELAEQIVSSVRAYKRTEQWQKDKGKFIPHPTTFLNWARWEDELPISRPTIRPPKQGPSPIELIKANRAKEKLNAKSEIA